MYGSTNRVPEAVGLGKCGSAGRVWVGGLGVRVAPPHVSSRRVAEALKLQRNPEHYLFLKLGGAHLCDSIDDKQHYANTTVTMATVSSITISTATLPHTRVTLTGCYVLVTQGQNGKVPGKVVVWLFVAKFTLFSRERPRRPILSPRASPR